MNENSGINMTISNNELDLNNLPKLSEVLLVEEALQNNKERIITMSKLKKILYGKITKNTLILILDYLKTKNKITITSKGIAWKNDTKNLLKTLDKLFKKSELTEENAIFFGKQINKKVAKKFRET